jgi:hypothetical protein
LASKPIPIGEIVIDAGNLEQIISEWETEADIAEKDGRPGVAMAIRYLLKDLIRILPKGEFEKIRKEKEEETRVSRSHTRKPITGDCRF